MDSLPGNHNKQLNRMLNKVEKRSVIGDVGFFSGGSERTTGDFTIASASTQLATDEVTITQQKLQR